MTTAKACDPWDFGSARYAQEDLPDVGHLTPYQDDVSRVIHSNFFRRLQGKSQLFPAHELDFFRNRLTHSLEVANIGKGIATKLNHERGARVALDVVELAGLCHDSGHPPFGHQGERALHLLMKSAGGFEGNAQTMHLVSKVEKLVNAGPAMYGIGEAKGDMRRGLNLTARSLASLLKYNREIPNSIPEGKKRLIKGYYQCDAETIRWVKEQITGTKNYAGEFKTIECAIMDIADDIAYSTFDLVDALHAGFIRASDLISGGMSESIAQTVADDVTKSLAEKGLMDKDEQVTATEVLDSVTSLFLEPLKLMKVKTEFHVDLREPNGYVSLRNFLRGLERLAKNGYRRSFLARHLVARFIDGIEFVMNEKYPILSSVELNKATLRQIECVKKFVFVAITQKSRVQVAEYRATHVIATIFKALIENSEGMLPDDYANMYAKSGNDAAAQKRVICDFIAGMTDRYALEFYGRLVSQEPETIFKPL